MLSLQKEIAAPRQRELDDGQPRHMASPATLATTLEGTRSGLGLCIDNDTAGVYCTFGVRFERSRKPESVHPFNQRSNLRFDHFVGSNYQTDSYRNHRLGFLRLSVAKSRSRIEALGIKSEQVDRFVNALWFNPEIEFRFRRKRFRSVELTIEAFDLLSQTAARYGRRGRKIFVVNQEPIVNAIRLIECLTLEEAEEVLVEPLTRWLEHPPEFDPEGWALPSLESFDRLF